jgi:hypothetical protein
LDFLIKLSSLKLLAKLNLKIIYLNKKNLEIKKKKLNIWDYFFYFFIFLLRKIFNNFKKKIFFPLKIKEKNLVNKKKNLVNKKKKFS